MSKLTDAIDKVIHPSAGVPAAPAAASKKSKAARAKEGADAEARLEDAHLKAHGPTPQPCPGDYVEKRGVPAAPAKAAGMKKESQAEDADQSKKENP